MRKTNLVKAVMLSCALLFASTDIRADEEADHAELRKIKAAYEEAVNKADPTKIAPYLSENVTGVMITGEEVKGFAGLEAYWKKIQQLMGPGGTYHVKVNADSTEFHGDVSISRGNTEDVVKLASGTEFRFTSFWTAVCRKENGAWKVVRMQATMDPVDNVFVKARVQTTKIAYGAIGVVSALLVVFFARVLRRKPNQQQPIAEK